ncbi:hypothetical protein CJ030_MR8G028442 [Morella rubra]|uniref:Uncharacterized protein n=1 Tax=Morella rubra TaxID=262757 RepID=A0A6A1UTM1_9ROSI|nr:hypothetical protein CJ030_MR8G028442 [Morella rubra]
MDPVFYKAAADGRMEAFEHTDYPLDFFRTVGNNTILHIYATSLIKESESTTAFVKAILCKCRSLLWETNNKGETPLYLAARYGHVSIVNCLIEHAKIDLPQDLESGIQAARKMLRITNKKKDTALHEAVRQNQLAVVLLLLKEDPDFSYSANDAGETPLYLAIERNFGDVALKILESCGSPSYGGPLGRTALHAAVIRHDNGMIGELLKRFGDLSKKADQNGWIPIHFAAFFDSTISARLLLEADRQAAYMKDIAGMTALQIAAHRGNNSVMETIISRCPDCCELVDNRGWNVLHFAIDGRGGKETVGVILKYSSLSNLLNEEDFDGNTPFHHQSNSKDIEEDLMDHPRVDKMAFNKLNLAGRDITLLGAKSPEKKIS